jgi:hypothetical protein
MPGKTLTVSFTKERETKNTVVYAEDGDPGQHKIGRLYIQKSADFSPEKIEVKVS